MGERLTSILNLGGRLVASLFTHEFFGQTNRYIPFYIQPGMYIRFIFTMELRGSGGAVCCTLVVLGRCFLIYTSVEPL
jgi:hypothetical protein